MTAPHLILIIALSVTLGTALSVLSGLPRAVSLWLARRRNQRLMTGRAKQERLDFGAMADLNLANWWKRRRR